MRCRYFIVIEKRECTQTHTKKYAYYFEFPCTLIIGTLAAQERTKREKKSQIDTLHENKK